MLIEFDPMKSDLNLRMRGLSFERAADFDFESASFSVDTRRDYGETRWIATGALDSRIHVLVFVETVYGIRVISLRKANKREIERYAKT